MPRIATLVPSLLTLTLLVVISGCAHLKSYKEPVSGASARVRLIGNQPTLYTGNCGNSTDGPSGFAYYGHKKHDLGMPKLPNSNDDYTEYRVVADKPLTITFADTEMVAPKGFRMVYSGPFCPHVEASFIPKAGHDYVLSENGYGECKASIAELITSVRSEVHEVPVTPLPACH